MFLKDDQFLLIGKKSKNSFIIENNVYIAVTEISIYDLVIVNKKESKKNKIKSFFIGYGKDNIISEKQAKEATEERKMSKSAKKRFINKPQEALLEGIEENITKNTYRKFTEIHTNKDLGNKKEHIVFDLNSFLNCLTNVTGVTKGKGFQGVVKRYDFKSGPRSHGASKFHRRPGSIGSGETFPARVLKNTRMPGNMGNEQKTVKNLRILKVDTERKIIVVKGLIPGSIKKDVKVLVKL